MTQTLYLLGGYGTGVVAEVWQFNLAANNRTWSPLPPLPTTAAFYSGGFLSGVSAHDVTVRSCSVFVQQGNLLFYGGYNGNAIIGDFWSYGLNSGVYTALNVVTDPLLASGVMRLFYGAALWRTNVCRFYPLPFDLEICLCSVVCMGRCSRGNRNNAFRFGHAEFGDDGMVNRSPVRRYSCSAIFAHANHASKQSISSYRLFRYNGDLFPAGNSVRWHGCELFYLVQRCPRAGF